MGLAKRHPGPLTPCAEPHLHHQPQLWPRHPVERDCPTIRSTGWRQAGVTWQVPCSPLGWCYSQGQLLGEAAYRRCPSPLCLQGDTMLSGVVSRSPKTPGIWKTQQPSGVCTCPASIPPWRKAPRLSQGNHCPQTQYLFLGAGTD